MVDEQFFGQELPHKFKISFSGCLIDCAGTSEVDLGFQGAVKPEWDEEKNNAQVLWEILERK